MNTYGHDIPRKLRTCPVNKINALDHSTTLCSVSLYTQLCPRDLVEHYTTLHYTTLHYTTLHYTTLHYTTLRYATLHYTTLHYTHILINKILLLSACIF